MTIHWNLSHSELGFFDSPHSPISALWLPCTCFVGRQAAPDLHGSGTACHALGSQSRHSTALLPQLTFTLFLLCCWQGLPTLASPKKKERQTLNAAPEPWCVKILFCKKLLEQSEQFATQSSPGWLNSVPQIRMLPNVEDRKWFCPVWKCRGIAQLL